MDFDTLFWIAIVFVYFLFQILGRRRTAQRPPAQPQRNREPENENLDEALQEIRRALGWPVEEAPQQPAPVEAAPRTKLPPRIPPLRNLAFRREEGFERTGKVSPVRAQKTPTLPVQKPKAPIHPIASRLREPQHLRQEFLIREILDRPIALRRHR